jgi:hypothetical protein
MLKKCLHIVVVTLFALSAIVATVQAKPICDMQMSMDSEMPCNMPCHEKNSQSDDSNCCGDSVRCNASNSMISSATMESLIYASSVKYPTENSNALGLFTPEALKSPPKHLS